jgi:hypothetical protein
LDSWNRFHDRILIFPRQNFNFYLIFRLSKLVLKNVLIMAFPKHPNTRKPYNIKFFNTDPATTNQTWKLTAAELYNADDKLSHGRILYHTRLFTGHSRNKCETFSSIFCNFRIQFEIHLKCLFQRNVSIPRNRIIPKFYISWSLHNWRIHFFNRYLVPHRSYKQLDEAEGYVKTSRGA